VILSKWGEETTVAVWKALKEDSGSVTTRIPVGMKALVPLEQD
jgi:hypothetical protein